MKNLDRNKLFVEMSGNFLTNQLPDDWNTWEETKINDFLEENVWEPFEYFSTDVVWGIIEDATNSAADFIERANLEENIESSKDLT
jgi:hypothetical protein